MTTIQLKSRVDGSGMLNLSIPLGMAEAHRVVQVIVQPADEILSAEQWQRFVHETAGCISDPSFRRHSPGEFEQRDELFS